MPFLLSGHIMRTIKLTCSLPAVLIFASLLHSAAVPVTFQVNMEFQTLRSSFNTAAEKLEVRGTFNDWAGGVVLTNSSGNTNLYQTTVEIARPAPGNSVEYKFIINGTTWEESSLGPGVNRSFTLSSNPQTLPIVYFSDEWIGTPIPVTFQVNMAGPIASSNFNPATDKVEARGSFQPRRKWKGGFTLTNTPSSPSIYRATYRVPLPPNSKIEYKYVIRANGEDDWESLSNRSFILSTSAQTLPVAPFNEQASK